MVLRSKPTDVEEPESSAGTVRTIVQQPALPKYRVPVFRALAARPGIDLKVVYAEHAPLVSGFDAMHVPMRTGRLGNHPIYWHSPQLDYAHPARADVLILSWDLHYASLVPALLKAKANGVPTILWGHGYSKQEALWRSWPRRKVAELATALLFYTHTVANRFINDYRWDPQRIFVALNSIDQAPIHEARARWLDRPKELEEFKQSHDLNPGPVILFISRLDPLRRVDLLIHAAVGLRRAYPHLRVIVIGTGEEQKNLETLVGALGLGDCVRFVGALYDEMQLAPWFLSASVFCFPSNMGLSLMHAFGYGLPVVTCSGFENHGPEIEALHDDENGLLYPPGSLEGLTAALLRLLEDEPLRQRMSQAALRTVTERFTLARMVDGFFAAIQYCAGHR